MIDFINKIAPNLIPLFPDLMNAFVITLTMVAIAFVFSLLIGLPLGVILLGCKNELLFNKPKLYSALSFVIDLLRSTPAVILITAIAPLTKIIVGTKTGMLGAVVPLIFAATPFLARQVEAALDKTDKGVIEAAVSTGASTMRVLCAVVVPEAIPSIINSLSITFVSLVGFSAIAGVVGGGGLGDFALRYGYQQFKTDIMVVAIILILALVSIVSFLCKRLSTFVDKSK